MSECAVGYAMGLIVDEGCFSFDGRAPALSVKLHERDRAPLAHVHAMFGGRVYGPYRSQGRHYRVWHLRGRPLEAALRRFERHLPPSHTREQFLAWLARYFPIIDVAARVAARWTPDPS